MLRLPAQGGTGEIRCEGREPRRTRRLSLQHGGAGLLFSWMRRMAEEVGVELEHGVGVAEAR